MKGTGAAMTRREGIGRAELRTMQRRQPIDSCLLGFGCPSGRRRTMRRGLTSPMRRRRWSRKNGGGSTWRRRSRASEVEMVTWELANGGGGGCERKQRDMTGGFFLTCGYEDFFSIETVQIRPRNPYLVVFQTRLPEPEIIPTQVST